MTTATGKTTPPSTVIAAFIGFLVSCVFAVTSVGVLVGSHDDLVEALRQSGTAMTEEQLQSAATFAQAMFASIAVVIALVQLWLAFKLRSGRNWARILLTVFTVFQIGSLFIGEGSATWPAYGGAIVAALAVVASYLPASNVYFDTVKRAG
ncbi:hypothetical protein SAMN05216188_106221 [Lentzea xinjiangensis]|uniref:DUF2127 domain-containing protein n=1 Tax=Lentzea xinjiangensis TaxID=402600 RepID=A0A1H9JZ89_9PSEU|nr:hypothetical protein [Lentzea xinjiangensis]SEQ92149.1 hypothetical protein SAMN05216188_106221 [Lentzea xinjiangensis]